MAANNPQQTHSLIFVDGVPGAGRTPGGNFFTGFLGFPPIQRYADVIGSRFLFNYKTFEKLLGDFYGLPPDAEAIEGYLEPFKTKRSAAVIIEMSTSINENEIDFTTLHGVPVLIIWGAEDSTFPLSSAEGFKTKFPHSRLNIIAGAGHCPMETHFGEFNEIFLRRINE
jgi:pimeloyl-ACP methyl ester carboxylesterase